MKTTIKAVLFVIAFLPLVAQAQALLLNEKHHSRTLTTIQDLFIEFDSVISTQTGFVKRGYFSQEDDIPYRYIFEGQDKNGVNWKVRFTDDSTYEATITKQKESSISTSYEGGYVISTETITQGAETRGNKEAWLKVKAIFKKYRY